MVEPVGEGDELGGRLGDGEPEAHDDGDELGDDVLDAEGHAPGLELVDALAEGLVEGLVDAELLALPLGLPLGLGEGGQNIGSTGQSTVCAGAACATSAALVPRAVNTGVSPASIAMHVPRAIRAARLRIPVPPVPGPRWASSK